MEPLLQAVGIRRTGVIEIGEKIILNGLVYDSDTLTPIDIFPFQRVNGPPLSRSDTIISSVGEGGQISSSASYTITSTLTQAPNMFLYNDVATQRLVDPNLGLYFLATENSDNSGLLADSNGNILQTLFDSADRHTHGILINLDNNEYLVNLFDNWGNNSSIATRVKYESALGKLFVIHYAKYGAPNNIAGNYLFKSSDSNLYFIWTGHANGAGRISYYSKSAQSFTHLNIDGAAWNIGHQISPSNILKADLNSNTKRFYIVRPASTSTIQIKLVTVDTANRTSTYDICNITTTGMNFYWDLNDARAHVIPFIHEYDGNTYLSFYVGLHRDAAGNLDNFKLYTFLIDSLDPKNLTFITQYSFNQQVIGAHISLDPTLNRLVFLGNNGLIQLNFLGTSWADNIISMPRPISAIYDTKGRLWITTDGDYIYMLIPQSPTNVIMNFEKQSYDYTGTPIQTFVKISVYNYLGQRLATNGTLKILSDNAVFLDGSKAKNIATSDTADIQVDFKITGAGIIRMIYEITL